jgi:hypothetical protein
VSVGFDFVDSRGAAIKNWWSLSAEQIERDAYYDLAEISAVPVPADPGAVRQTHAAFAAAGAEMLELAGWSQQAGGLLSPPQPGAGPDGLPQLVPPQAPQFPGNDPAAQRLADLEARFAALASGLAVIPAHSTLTIDAAWEIPDLTSADSAGLRAVHAWVDPAGDPQSAASYRFAHHGPGGAANMQACQEALGHLEEIPEPDRAGVERHLRRHIDEHNQGNGAAGTYTTDTAQGFLAAIRL